MHTSIQISDIKSVEHARSLLIPNIGLHQVVTGDFVANTKSYVGCDTKEIVTHIRKSYNIELTDVDKPLCLTLKDLIYTLDEDSKYNVEVLVNHRSVYKDEDQFDLELACYRFETREEAEERNLRYYKLVNHNTAVLYLQMNNATEKKDTNSIEKIKSLVNDLTQDERQQLISELGFDDTSYNFDFQ